MDQTLKDAWKHEHLGITSTEIWAGLGRQLEQARKAPRCTHVKSNGLRCGSPAMREQLFCYAHMRLLEKRTDLLELVLPLEDHNAIQVALSHLVKEFLAGRVERQQAYVLLYALQTASANLKHVKFSPGLNPYNSNEIVTELPSSTTDHLAAVVPKQPLASVKP